VINSFCIWTQVEVVGWLCKGADVPVCEVQAEVVHLLDQAQDVPMLHPHTVLQHTCHQLFQRRVVIY
jgi:hypothetical protein